MKLRRNCFSPTWRIKNRHVGNRKSLRGNQFFPTLRRIDIFGCWLLAVGFWLLAIGASTPIAPITPMAPITPIALANSQSLTSKFVPLHEAGTGQPRLRIYNEDSL